MRGKPISFNAKQRFKATSKNYQGEVINSISDSEQVQARLNSLPPVNTASFLGKLAQKRRELAAEMVKLPNTQRHEKFKNQIKGIDIAIEIFSEHLGGQENDK